MDLKAEEKGIDEKPVDLKTGSIGAAAGAVATALVMLFSGKAMDEATVQTAIDTLAVQGKVCELVEVKDKLALASDSIKPAYKKVYPEQVTRDSTGKIIKTVKADTVDVPAAPVLAGFPDGVSDYPMAAIVKAGSTLRIVYILDGKEINSHLIQPKTADWLISEKPTASIHSGK
jgi:hypothetical protein